MFCRSVTTVQTSRSDLHLNGTRHLLGDLGVMSTNGRKDLRSYTLPGMPRVCSVWHLACKNPFTAVSEVGGHYLAAQLLNQSILQWNPEAIFNRYVEPARHSILKMNEVNEKAQRLSPLHCRLL